MLKELKPTYITSASKDGKTLSWRQEDLAQDRAQLSCKRPPAFLLYVRHWTDLFIRGNTNTAISGKVTFLGILNYRCSVCTHKFSVAPPRPTLSFRLRRILSSYACEVTGLVIMLVSTPPLEYIFVISRSWQPKWQAKGTWYQGVL